MKVLTNNKQLSILERVIKLDKLIDKVKDSELRYDLADVLDDISEECLSERQLDYLTEYFLTKEGYEEWKEL